MVNERALPSAGCQSILCPSCPEIWDLALVCILIKRAKKANVLSCFLFCFVTHPFHHSTQLRHASIHSAILRKKTRKKEIRQKMDINSSSTGTKAAVAVAAMSIAYSLSAGKRALTPFSLEIAACILSLAVLATNKRARLLLKFAYTCFLKPLGSHDISTQQGRLEAFYKDQAESR